MAGPERQRYALQTIFSFFLGLMVATFVGVGVNTFYPSPDAMTGSASSFSVWQRNTSIVVIVIATAVMALSLIRSEQLKVLSNGLLLGGLFTMLYGLGWLIASGQSTVRFLVMAFALAVTIGLGYMRFVRGRQPQAGPEPRHAAADVSEMAELTARVEALEARLAAAAAALEPDAREERAG